MAPPEVLASPLYALLIVLEAVWRRRIGRPIPAAQARASIISGIGFPLAGVGNWAATTAVLGATTHLRLPEIAMDRVWKWIALVLAVDLSFYWLHRLSHRCRWLWASHAVHHTSEDMNFTAALRLGWTDAIAGGWLFWLPMVWIGFPPQAVFPLVGLNLVYQFLLHTERIGRLGPLEWLLNTPSHHRVHHARNPEYVDKNFAGVLIVFDRLFGTFASEHAANPCEYGRVHRVPSSNLLVIQLHEWARMLRDVCRARSVGEGLHCLFGAPGLGAGGPSPIPGVKLIPSTRAGRA